MTKKLSVASDSQQMAKYTKLLLVSGTTNIQLGIVLFYVPPLFIYLNVLNLLHIYIQHTGLVVIKDESNPKASRQIMYL